MLPDIRKILQGLVAGPIADEAIAARVASQLPSLDVAMTPGQIAQLRALAWLYNSVEAAACGVILGVDATCADAPAIDEARLVMRGMASKGQRRSHVLQLVDSVLKLDQAIWTDASRVVALYEVIRDQLANADDAYFDLKPETIQRAFLARTNPSVTRVAADLSIAVGVEPKQPDETRAGHIKRVEASFKQAWKTLKTNTERT